MVQLRQGVLCERVGDSWLVFVRQDGVAHKVSGLAATVIDCVTGGRPIPPECNDALDALVAVGMLTPATGWSRRRILTAAAAAAAVGVTSLTLPTAAAAASPAPTTTAATTTTTPGPGVEWAPSAASEANSWSAVAYGSGVWVATSNDGTNRVMRSTDGGVTWTAESAAEANVWVSVASGNGKFVAVAATGTNRVMYSPAPTP